MDAQMEFFDCNTYIGCPVKGHMAPVATAAELLAEMDRAGIARALVWHVAQLDYSPVVGNQLLAEAIAPYERLAGCWTLLPNQANELGPLSEWFELMSRSNVRAVRAFPEEHHYLLRGEALGDILSAMVEKRIPLLLSLQRGLSWQDAYVLMAQFPELVCILCDIGSWGSDRWFRPLLESYSSVYIELGQYYLDGGIEAFVRDYGPDRMLFGTGFPDGYHGGAMLPLEHAQIGPAERQAIASGNMQRILSEVRL